MNKEYGSYIDKIVSSIVVNGKRARRVREDLYSSLIEKQQITGETNPYILMGDPEEVAEEFRENIGIESRHDHEDYWYEYKSGIKIFGIPLVHINCKPLGIAKGVISVGNLAVGVIAFGGISAGILSFGGIAAGIIMALGGIGVSLGISIGGIAVSGIISFGGLAISKFISVGGYSVANIAIGGGAKGIISVFRQSGEGKYLFDSSSNIKEIIDTIKEVYPSISEKFINIIEKIVSLFLLA